MPSAFGLALLCNVNDRATPSLRIERLAIQNFRTFHGRTEIVLSSKDGADAMPVFHGLNGSGKSNALAAIELFFSAASSWLSLGAAVQPRTLVWNTANPTGLVVTHRNWPPGIRAPQVIEVYFADATLGRVSVTFTQAGNEVHLMLHWLHAGDSDYLWLKTALETPRGPGSAPFFRLDARRRATGQAPPIGPLSPTTAGYLYELATSLEPSETERWRSFVSLINRFKTLSGREVTVVPGRDSADLRFEIRGKQILRLSELSSGEQQVVALVAAVLTSRAAIVAIEEPEISLHPDNQQLVRDVLREQVERGVVDQIILESHVLVFDGPEVIRFCRSDEGVTSVARQAAGADDQLRTRAKASGAEEEWVSPEGYTRLPEEMRQDLELDQGRGGYLWFLRSKPDGRWQAWRASDLDRMFGWGDGGSKEK